MIVNRLVLGFVATSAASVFAASNVSIICVDGLRPERAGFGAPAKYMKHYEGVGFPSVPHPEKPTGKTTRPRAVEFTGYNRWGKDPRETEAFSLEVRRHYAACVSHAGAQVGKHALFEESLHSPLISKYPGMPRPGEKTGAVISTDDVFATLGELTPVPVLSFLGTIHLKMEKR